MSSTTWTPTEVASSAIPFRGTIWRAVEAQHQVSTLALVDTLDEQKVLERLLEESKPALLPECAGLHWLLSTPFRYHPLRTGSRFRAVTDAGVFYGADEIRTTCAELGYWRWRFLMDSSLSHIEPKAQTVFSVSVRGRCVDLRRPPYDTKRRLWCDARSYTACQAFARLVREADIPTLRYESVRDPEHGACLAVLDPRAFDDTAPVAQQTWFLSVKRDRVLWTREFLTERSQMEFETEEWLT